MTLIYGAAGAREKVDLPAHDPEEIRDDVVAVAHKGEASMAQVARDFGTFGDGSEQLAECF